MLRKMVPRIVVSAIAVFLTTTNAIPTITFPINSQVPPVLRISQPFEYVFPSSTFFSNLPLTYTLTSGPDWLFLDSDTRTLRGTPADGILGEKELLGVSFELTATDTSGSVTSSTTLVVSKNPAPQIAIPLSAQSESYGIFSEPSTFLYHPSTPFQIDFQPGTFSYGSSGGPGAFYYAVTTENTPLPAWISFDKDSLTFAGQTPDYYSLIQPPQTFGIQLIASDVEGFGGVSIKFYVEVGVHLFAFTNQTLHISVASNETLDYQGLLETLELDGQSASTIDIASTTAEAPSWITFDHKTLGLSGIAPGTPGLVNVTVQAKDVYDDTTTVLVIINVTSKATNATVATDIFNRQITHLNATIGSSFSYDLGLYLNNRSDTMMAVQPATPQSWLSFNDHSLLLSGKVPSSVQPFGVLVTVNVTSVSQHTEESQSFMFSIDAKSSVSTSASPTPSPTTTPTPNTKPSGHHLSKRAIAAIVVPLTLLAVALLLLGICYCRRRRAASKYRSHPSKDDISSPLTERPSMVQIIRPGRLNPPEPLQLDTTGFANPNESITVTEDTQIRRASRVSTVSGMTRSKSLMAVAENPHSPLQESTNSGNRARAASENELSKSRSSWRSTEGSVYPTLRSSGTGSSATHNRLSRNYSNYSRKGHTRRSAMIFETDTLSPTKGSIINSQTTGDSILGLNDYDLSSTPIDEFSTLARHTSVQDTPNTYARKSNLHRTSRRRSRFMSSPGRPLSGLGHGTRPSFSSISGGIEKRRSIGHGQDYMDGHGLSRDSRTWLTVGTNEMSEHNRRSLTSALSEYSRDDGNELVDPRIRAVTKSPTISRSNTRERRPVSRRVGSSPFFAGSSTHSSRRAPKKIRVSYADSPTVPEEATMANNFPAMYHPNVEDPHMDGLGISFGRARESTRILKSYVQSHLPGTKSKHSMRSIESKDSRFESAAGSMLSRPQSRSQRSPERPARDDGYEEFMRDGFSEESWETQGSAHADQENVTVFDKQQSAEEIMLEAAQARRNIGLADRPGTSASNPVSKRPGSAAESGRGIRFMLGAARRPLSVDASHRASRAVVQRGSADYTAYI